MEATVARLQHFWAWLMTDAFPIATTSSFRTRWDALMSLVLLYIVITVPLRIGFNLNDWTVWMVPDLVTDLLLVLDMLLWSLSCYEHEGEEVKDFTNIRLHYLRHFFIIDLLTILPLEVFVVLLPSYNAWLRVNRLLRLMRLNYHFSSWEMVSFLKPSVIRIIRSIFIILGLGHIIGCTFFLVIVWESGDAATSFVGTVDIRSEPLYSQYNRAFYWAFATMMGYNSTNPDSYLETVLSIIVTLLGISLVATTIGSVGSLLTTMDSSAVYYRQKVDSINDYMKYKQIPESLQEEVRNYFQYLWKTGKGLDKFKAVDDLPPYLKNKLRVALNFENIRKVPLFEKVKDDDAFITEIVKCLKPQVFLPNSVVVSKGDIGTQMYFIHHGELCVVSEDDHIVLTLKDGGFFGEVALMYDTRRTATIVARTYCDLFVLEKQDLKKVMKKFPVQSDVIREAARQRFQAIVDQEKKKGLLESGTEDDKGSPVYAFGEGSPPVSLVRASSDQLRVASPTGSFLRQNTASPKGSFLRGGSEQFLNGSPPTSFMVQRGNEQLRPVPSIHLGIGNLPPPANLPFLAPEIRPTLPSGRRLSVTGANSLGV